MKILHVVPTYLPATRYGGPIVAVHGLCRALAARGHEVSVFTTNVDGAGELDVPLYVPVDVDGVQVHYFPTRLRRLYWSPTMRSAMRRRVGDFDLVHTHAVYLWPGTAAVAAAAAARVPAVVSPRGMLVPELIRARNAFVKRVWLTLQERRRFRRATAVHFTSRLEWDDASRVGLQLNRPFVVPNGVDLSPRPEVPRDDRSLLFLGRVSWKKGIDVVIRLLPSLPGARLTVAGNDEENLTRTLADLAQRLGVADRVTFLGPVHGEAKNELLARAALFVLLSKSENFGNAVLEALAMETPVVLSPEVGISQEVVAAGAGAIGGEEIEKLLRDPLRRSQMGKNGRDLVQARYTWDRVAAETEAAYQDLFTTAGQGR